MSLAQVLSLTNYRSKQLVEDAKYHVSMGEFDTAIETFRRSIEIEPSAEAYTYLAWILSLKDETDQAIELCRKAIALDPDFGNPLNDIGSYLIQKGLLEEAIPWLEKAKLAPRSDARHFPYLNLGRIYSAQGNIEKAILEFREALRIMPGHVEIQNVLEQLQKIQNSK